VFGLHLISASQLPVAWEFALGSGRTRDKFAGLATMTQRSGAPLLADCVAWFDCQVFARLATGDRTFFWADVQAAGRVRDEMPAREQDLLHGASDEQKRQLLSERDADIRMHRPLWEAWRGTLPAWLIPAGSGLEKADQTLG
jgi:flavin reductase (DIM6/NTAB) family NADH-FMN oxidoreductase RutF